MTTFLLSASGFLEYKTLRFVVAGEIPLVLHKINDLRLRQRRAVMETTLTLFFAIKAL